jgi:hypothetical protein
LETDLAAEPKQGEKRLEEPEKDDVQDKRIGMVSWKI